jgi:hypothetical protein
MDLVQAERVIGVRQQEITDETVIIRGFNRGVVQSLKIVCPFRRNFPVYEVHELSLKQQNQQ